jgi:hypothetical protein
MRLMFWLLQLQDDFHCLVQLVRVAFASLQRHSPVLVERNSACKSTLAGCLDILNRLRFFMWV